MELVKKLREYAGAIFFVGVVVILFVAYSNGIRQYDEEHNEVRVNETQK